MEGEFFSTSRKIGENQNNIETADTSSDKKFKKIDLAWLLRTNTRSPLVEKLIGFDKAQINEVVEQILTTISKKFSQTYVTKVRSAVFKSLEAAPFADRIKTLEDLSRYVEDILQFAFSYLKESDSGVKEGDHEAAHRIQYVVEAATKLVRDDFDKDIDTLVQMLQSSGLTGDIILSLSKIRHLMVRSADVQRFSTFVERMTKKGIDVKKIINGELSMGLHWSKKPLFGFLNEDAGGSYHISEKEPFERFDQWKSILVDSKKIDSTLSLVEQISTPRFDVGIFINGVGRRFIARNSAENIDELGQLALSTLQRTVADYGDHYGYKVADQVFTALAFEPLISRSKTVQDVRNFAEKILTVAELHVKKGNEHSVDHYAAANYTANTVQEALSLIRDDFDNDFAELLDMMRSSPSSDSMSSIFGAVKNIRCFIRESKDVERVGRTVKKIVQHGLDPKEFFLDQKHEPSFFGNQDAALKIPSKNSYQYIDNPTHKRLDSWREIISNSKDFDDALSVAETAFIENFNYPEFLAKLNGFSTKEKAGFVAKVSPFAKKDIPPQFFLEAKKDTVAACDASKEGLAMFKTTDSKKKWLEYCVFRWNNNDALIPLAAPYFNEALEAVLVTDSVKKNTIARIKGLNSLSMFEIQDAVDDDLGTTRRIVQADLELRTYATELLTSSIKNLLQEKKFKVIFNLKEHVPGVVGIIAKIDREYAQNLPAEDIDTYIEDKFGRTHTMNRDQILATYPLFESEFARKIFPESFSRAVQMHYRTLFNVGEDDTLAHFKTEKIESFLKIVGEPPENELLQQRYFELFDLYIRTYYEGYDGENDYVDRGENYLKKLVDLEKMTGKKIQFETNKIIELYKFCLNAGENYVHKIDSIEKLTGVQLDDEIVQNLVLDNQNFNSSISYKISHGVLDKYFAKTENHSLREYKRIYKIFGCFDYYQDIIGQLQLDQHPHAKQSTIELLMVMGLREEKNIENYALIKEKLMSYSQEGGLIVPESLAKACAELVKSGDVSLSDYLISILKDRTKKSTDNKEQYGPLGVTKVQKIALRALRHIDTPSTNAQLFSLTFVNDLDPRVRTLILQQMLVNTQNFFPAHVGNWIKSELETKKTKYAAEELKYFQSTLQIPSTDLRKKTIQHFDDVFSQLIEKKLLPSHIHREVCPAVPENILLPLWQFAQGDKDMLQQFNELYKLMKSSSDREALLYGIVNTLSIKPELLKKLIAVVRTVDISAQKNATKLASVLKTVQFLDTVERRPGNWNREELLAILGAPVDSLTELQDRLKNVTTQKMQGLLPHAEIHIDSIEKLWQEWGSLEPIFVYASKIGYEYKGTLNLLAEMVVKMDAPAYAMWKDWRYDVDSVTVKNQVGHLSSDQMTLWKKEYCLDIGSEIFNLNHTDKPKKIAEFFENAVREKHIYHPDIHAHARHKFIQDELDELYKTIEKQPDQKDEIVVGAISGLRADMSSIDAYIRYNDVPKIKQAFDYFSAKKIVPASNAKTKNTLAFLGKYIDADRFQIIEKKYKEFEKSGIKMVSAEELVGDSFGELLDEIVRNLTQEYQRAQNSTVFDTYALDKESTNTIGQLYQKRNEIKALVDICQLNVLKAEHIATNRISNQPHKKSESLESVISNLKNYFKDNPTFVQDIDNIESSLAQRDSVGSKKRLAMVITDNPQILLQIGKYPLGCGSCQNYEGSSEWNKALAGYMADAHTKVAMLVDLNKLPEAKRLDIKTYGFENIKSTIHPQELLEASVARSVIKLTATADQKPVLFIEPTYSSINKADKSMNDLFNVVLKSQVSDPMGIQIARGGTRVEVSVAKSRNPSGQYEDCAAGNAGHVGMGIQYDSYTMGANLID